LPEARAAAPGFLAGFLDQFMPALIAANIDSELTRFVLAGLSISQLIYMAEVGVLIIRSSLPLDFGQLLVIFALRTVIVLPVFLVSGAWLL
jgi:nucleoside recognition membrane protein YjiH